MNDLADIALFIGDHAAVCFLLLLSGCVILMVYKSTYVGQEVEVRLKAAEEARKAISRRSAPVKPLEYNYVEPDETLLEPTNSELNRLAKKEVVQEITMEQFNKSQYPTLTDIMELPKARRAFDASGVEEYAKIQKMADEANALEAAQRVIDRIQGKRV
jgi:hypothetical protein